MVHSTNQNLKAFNLVSRNCSLFYSTGARIAARSTSPYRSGSRGTVNLGYSSSILSEGGSRRASSSVSQVGLKRDEKWPDGV